MKETQIGSLLNLAATALGTRFQKFVDEGLAKTQSMIGFAPPISVAYAIYVKVGDEARALVGGHDSFTNTELSTALRQSADHLESEGRYAFDPDADLVDQARAFLGETV